MRARLTEIALDMGPGRRFEIGAVVVGGEDIPLELLEARLAARTAELVGERHEPSQATAGAIAAWQACFPPLHAALLAAIEAVEAGGLADARAFVDALTEAAPVAHVLATDARTSAIFKRVREADEAELQSLTGGSPVPGGAEAGGDAASEADAEDGPASAEISSGADSAASTDAPQPNAGTDGEAAEAPASAVEPAAPSDTSTPAKKPARKGAARRG